MRQLNLSMVDAALHSNHTILVRNGIGLRSIRRPRDIKNEQKIDNQGTIYKICRRGQRCVFSNLLCTIIVNDANYDDISKNPREWHFTK
jgi:hypothetical protein